MAVTALTIYEPVLAGTKPVPVAPTGTGLGNGVSFANDGQTCLVGINAGAGSSTPTYDATGSLGGVALTDPTGTAIANDSVPVLMGPFDRAAFGATMTIGFSLATGLTVFAVRLPRL